MSTFTEKGSRVVITVIPAFNEESTIGAVVAQLLRAGYYPVVVDDGSSDNTALVAERSGATVVKHEVNMGQGAALNTGIALAATRQPAVIVTFDADGQHDVEDIKSLTKPILAGEADVVLGSRFLGAAINLGLARLLILKAAILFTRMAVGLNVTDSHNGLRAISGRAANSFRLKCLRMGHASEIYDWIVEHRFRYKEVGVTITYTPSSLAKGQKNFGAFLVLTEYGSYRFKKWANKYIRWFQHGATNLVHGRR